MVDAPTVSSTLRRYCGRSLNRSLRQFRRCVVTAQQPAVKKYIVKLSAEERNRLDVLIQKGNVAARQLLKARILLKADASTAGEAWSDSRIAAALDTSIDTIARTRQQVEERAGCGADPQAFA